MIESTFSITFFETVHTATERNVPKDSSKFRSNAIRKELQSAKHLLVFPVTAKAYQLCTGASNNGASYR